MSPKQRTEVDALIVGAGIAGIATAWQLAERLGTTNAIIVDPRPPLSLTSDRPEANYRNWWPQRPMVALANRSIDLMDALRAEGARFDMNRRGYLYVTADPARAAGLTELVERYAAAGLTADSAEVILDGRDLRARYPHLSAAISGAIHARRAGSVDTVGLGRALLAQASERGIRVVRGEVTGLDPDGRGGLDVFMSTPDGSERFTTRRLVDAAGPFAATVAGLAGLHLELETVLRQKVLLVDPVGIVPRSAPFTIGLDPLDGLPAGVHVKPDDSVRPDAIKLGWARDQDPRPPITEPTCPAEYPEQVLARAATIVPGLEAYSGARMQILAHDGGFYARTPDGLPLIGRLEVPGMFAIAGLAGFGAMLACAAAELLAGWLLDEPASELAASFDPARFNDQATPVRTAAGVAPPGEL
ncbi:MAG: NAD(P)/FAD-dependent oxidoreductase [Candidatus Limnocylindrales bacterium]